MTGTKRMLDQRFYKCYRELPVAEVRPEPSSALPRQVTP